MDEATLIQSIADFTGQLALSAVLIYLLLDERRQHRETREQHRSDMIEAIREISRTVETVRSVQVATQNGVQPVVQTVTPPPTQHTWKGEEPP